MSPSLAQPLDAWERDDLVVEVKRLRAQLAAADREVPTFEASLRSVAELSGLGVWDWNVRTEVLTWSQGMHELTGIPPSPERTYGDILEARLHEEDRNLHRASVGAALQEAARRAVDEQRAVALPSGAIRLRFSSPTGPKSTQSVCVAVAAPDGPQRVWGIMLDTTEEREAQQRQRESEARLQAFHEATFEGLIMVREGLIQDCNPAFESLLGVDHNALSGRPLLSVVVPSDRDRAECLLSKHDDEQAFLRLRAFERGPTLRVHARATASDAQRGGLQVIAVRDVTQQAELERELRHARKMESLGTLASGIAHEFNNILTAVAGFTEMAMDDLPSDAPTCGLLQDSLKAVDRAKDVVAQIQTFGRPDGFGKEVVNIRRCIDDTMRMLQASLPPTVKLTSHCDADAGHVLADPTQITQVLVNLCSNAWQAKADARIQIEARRCEVQTGDLNLNLTRGPWVHLCVKDDGPGMDPGVMERAFEPFFTTKTGGTGMGLAVVHGIITGYGGQIHLSSTLGEGTRFDAYIPWTAAPAPARPAPAPSASASGPPTARIMLVDDEAPVARVGSLLLKSLHYDVDVFEDPFKALEKLTQGPQDFDLLVTDQSMPTLQGMELAAKVRQLSATLPILICTGCVSALDPEQLDRLNVQAVLQKPYSRRRLQELVELALARN